MYQLKRGFSDVQKFDIAAVEAKYGLKKDQFLDLKSLKGDSYDNIPGVPALAKREPSNYFRSTVHSMAYMPILTK